MKALGRLALVFGLLGMHDLGKSTIVPDDRIKRVKINERVIIPKAPPSE